MMRTARHLLTLAALLPALTMPVVAEEAGSPSEKAPASDDTSHQSEEPCFGGPNAVENQLHEDQQPSGSTVL